MPTSPKPAEPATPNTVRVVVHPRRSAVYDVQIGTQIVDGKEVPVIAHRLALGGETIEVSAHDAAHMLAHGFAVSEDELAAHREMAAQLAASQKEDGIVRHTLHEQVAGSVGLQRPGASDAW